MMESSPDIQIDNLSRIYHVANESVHAVNNVTLAIQPRQMAAIVGRSGSGKTTLLNLIAGLDHPTSGDVLILGQLLTAMSEAERLALRREKIGFVFQAFGLLPLLTATENIEVPLRM